MMEESSLLLALAWAEVPSTILTKVVLAVRVCFCRSRSWILEAKLRLCLGPLPRQLASLRTPGLILRNFFAPSARA